MSPEGTPAHKSSEHPFHIETTASRDGKDRCVVNFEGYSIDYEKVDGKVRCITGAPDPHTFGKYKMDLAQKAAEEWFAQHPIENK